MSNGSGVVHDGQSFAQSDHVEQPVDRRGRAHHDEARSGRGGRLLGLDHRGETLGVHERDFAQVEHDGLAALDGSGQLRAEDVDRREVDITADGDDLRGALRRNVDAEFRIGDQAIISAYWTA
jgi:hypothetical protein